MKKGLTVFEWSRWVDENWPIKKRILHTKMVLMSNHWQKFFANRKEYDKWHKNIFLQFKGLRCKL